MIANPPHRPGDRERYGDIVVERGLDSPRGRGGNGSGCERIAGCESSQRHPSTAGIEQPIHLDEAGQSGVQEEVDRLGLGDAALSGEADRIDLEDALVRRRSDQRLQTRYDPGAPAPRGTRAWRDAPPEREFVDHAIAPSPRLGRRRSRDTEAHHVLPDDFGIDLLRSASNGRGGSLPHRAGIRP